MVDFAIVEAFFVNSKTLLVECPYCHRTHYHLIRGSLVYDIRETNCAQKDLPKKLRGKALYYRLVFQFALGSWGEVIPFPKPKPAVHTNDLLAPL